MRKLVVFYILTFLILSTTLVACSSKTPNPPINTNSTTPTENTKEFTYLPSYNGAQLKTFTPATKEDPFAQAEYLIPNIKDVQVYDDYKALLIKDGWTITDEMAVAKFSANKDSHVANIAIMISNNDVSLNVRSK